MPYIFVTASIIATLAIVILFKTTIEKIKENPDSANQAQTRFFIGVSLSEFIPIILIVYGFANTEKVSDIADLYIPGLIIILTIAIAVFFILLQRMVSIEEQAKNAVQIFTILSLVMITAIPFISLIGLFLMVQ